MTQLSKAPQPSSTAKPLPDEWVEKLFAKLTAIYGAKMKNQWDGVDLRLVKAEWGEALAGYDPKEIKAGLDACRQRDWPPILPEFLKMCRPALDYEVAYAEAVQMMRYRHSSLKPERDRERWSHPAVFWAAAQLGVDLTVNRYEHIKARWQAELDKAIKASREGRLPPIPKPPELLAAPAPMSKAEAAERLQKIRDMLEGKQ